MKVALRADRDSLPSQETHTQDRRIRHNVNTSCLQLGKTSGSKPCILYRKVCVRHDDVQGLTGLFEYHLCQISQGIDGVSRNSHVPDDSCLIPNSPQF